MLINVRAKSKVRFVLETCKRSDYGMRLEEQWEKCNCFILAWIMNTVSKELICGIMYDDDATTVWRYLKERFEKLMVLRSTNCIERSSQYIKVIDYIWIFYKIATIVR